MKGARELAVEALMRVEQQKAYSNLVLDHLLSRKETDEREAKLASALVYGVLERKLTLDACIRNYSKIRLEKMTPEVREILRVSLYQLLYLDGVPDRAAVDEGVKLTRVFRKASASGFVNGVLRAFLREEKQIPLPQGRLERLSVQYSMAPWIIDLWEKSYGLEAAARMLEAFLEKPRTFICINPLKNSPEELKRQLEERDIVLHLDKTLALCGWLEGMGELKSLPEFQQGRFHVQSRASQICAGAVGVLPRHKVLDVCAAPGGKTFTMAELMGDTGQVSAFDLYEHRAGLIAAGAKRLGLGCVQAKTGDATVLKPELVGQFDRVLCDVPCSGLGMLGRKPELRYRDWKDSENLPEIQYKILETSANYLKEGGILVYSTCTLNLAENEEVTARFLTEHPEFVPEPFGEAFCAAKAGEQAADTGEITLLPQRDGPEEGFYIRKMRKTNHCGER